MGTKLFHDDVQDKDDWRLRTNEATG